MLVPEATMDEDNSSILGKNNVRLTGEVGTVQAEPKPLTVKVRSHLKLWLRVAPLDLLHYPAADLWAESVGHRTALLRPFWIRWGS